MTRPTKSTIALSVIILAGLAFILPACRAPRSRYAMAESVRNVKQIKLCLDSFAMDNNGKYPSAKTADFYELPNPKSSNDLFRQLHASGNTNSEKIFWVKDSKVCARAKPDDLTTAAGKFDPAQTLRPGDNHWAYFTGLKNVNFPSIPLVIDSYLPGTTTFDKKIFDNKVIVLRIDGSARPERLSPAGLVLDGDNKNLLTTDSVVWKDATPDLRQPDPAP